LLADPLHTNGRSGQAVDTLQPAGPPTARTLPELRATWYLDFLSTHSGTNRVMPGGCVDYPRNRA